MSSERDPLLREEEDTASPPSPSSPNRSTDGKFTLLEKVLFALATTFFITLCILAGLYTRRVYEERPPSHTVPPPSSPGANNTSVSVCVNIYTVTKHPPFFFHTPLKHDLACLFNPRLCINCSTNPQGNFNKKRK